MIKPFLTNKAHINREEIIFKCDNETITESSVLAEMFTLHKYCRKNTGEKPFLVTVTFLILHKL